MRDGGSALAAHWRRRRLMRFAVLLHRCRLRLRAIDKTFRASFRTLRPFRPLRTREALRALVPLSPILAVAPILTRAAITAVAAAITILPVIAIVAALALAMLWASVLAHARTAVVIARAIVVARLTLVTAHGLRLRHRPHIAAEIVTVLVAELIARPRLAAERCRTNLASAVLDVAALGNLLFAERQDDAVIMLGVLEIVLSQNGIAARLRISRQRHVFLCNM
jgi:hypothetical protein